MGECLLYPEPDGPDAELVRRFEALPTPVVSDCLGRMAGSPGLLPVSGLPADGSVVGPCFTVRTPAGDNLAVHQALEIARPGDVVVIDAGGHADRAIIGALMAQYASTRRIGAIVVDGAVRDVAELRELPIPVFARAVTHLGPYKNGPGELRGPVSLGGLPVQAGDLLIGDADGVAIVPRARIESTLAAAEHRSASEREQVEAIANGSWDRSWLDEAVDIVTVR